MKDVGKVVGRNSSDQTKYDRERTFVLRFLRLLDLVSTFVQNTVRGILLSLHGLMKKEGL
jgi:hypothetical protein